MKYEIWVCDRCGVAVRGTMYHTRQWDLCAACHAELAEWLDSARRRRHAKAGR